MRRTREQWVATICAVMAFAVYAADIQKADNRDALSLGSSWMDGIAPGTNDVAVWNGATAASGPWTYGLGTNVAWYGLSVTNAVSMLTITNDGSVLTLGAGGMILSNSYNCLNCAPVALAALQAWRFAGSTILYQWGAVSGEGPLTLGDSGSWGQFTVYGDHLAVDGGSRCRVADTRRGLVRRHTGGYTGVHGHLVG